MSYYDIQVRANLHRPIKYNQGRRQGKSLEGGKAPRGPWGSAYSKPRGSLRIATTRCFRKQRVA